jgi:ribose-phosphate pyrophosphokinase
MKPDEYDNVVLVSNQASAALGKKIAAAMGIPFTEVERKQFADGEMYHAFPDELAGKDVIVVGATHNDQSHQELMDLIAGARFWNAGTVNVVIPYLGYSTMERSKPGSGEVPKGITRTRQIFQALPDFVAFIDLHSEAVLHAHDGNIHTKHIQTDLLVIEKIRALQLHNYVLVSPDYGRSKWVASLASQLDVAHTAADKDRYATDKTMASQVSSVVHGKTAVICDDMIRTGGSIINTARRCKEAGAISSVLMATHLVLCGDARQRISAQKINKVIGADTYPERQSDELLDVYSVATLVAGVLSRQLKLGVMPAG